MCAAHYFLQTWDSMNQKLNKYPGDFFQIQLDDTWYLNSYSQLFRNLCSIRKITNTRQTPSPVHCSSSSWRKEILPGPNHPSVTVQECLGRVQSQIIVSRPMPRSCVPCYRPLMAGTPQVAAYLSYSRVSQLVDLNSLVNKVNTGEVKNIVNNHLFSLLSIEFSLLCRIKECGRCVQKYSDNHRTHLSLSLRIRDVCFVDFSDLKWQSGTWGEA